MAKGRNYKAKENGTGPWISGQQLSQGIVERAKELRKQGTPEEKILWNRLRSNQLEGFHFRRQQIIAGYYVDFYCHQAGLVIEVDGGVHDDQQDYDHDRDQVLTSLGLRVIRIHNSQVRTSLEDVVNSILNACHQTFPATPPSLQGRGPGG